MDPLTFTLLPPEIRYRVMMQFKAWNSTPDSLNRSIHHQLIQRRALSQLCLASHQTYETAKPILWSDPFLSQLHQFQKFMDRTENLHLVRRLYLKRFGLDAQSPLLESLHQCSRLKILHLRVPNFTPLNLEQLFTHLPELVSFYFDVISSSTDESQSLVGENMSRHATWDPERLVETVKGFKRLTDLDLYLGNDCA